MQDTILIVANTGALVTVAGVGYRIIRHLARMEMRVDLMWSEFKERFHVKGAEK